MTPRILDPRERREHARIDLARVLQQRNRAHQLGAVLESRHREAQRHEERLALRAGRRLQPLDHRLVARLVRRRAVRAQLLGELLRERAIDCRRRVLEHEPQRRGELGQAMDARLHDVDPLFEPRHVEERPHERRELRGAHRVDVLPVQPLELLRIEHGRRGVHAIEREVLDRVLAREDVQPVRRGPAEEGQVVQHRVGQEALFRVRGDRGRAVPLRELACGPGRGSARRARTAGRPTPSRDRSAPGDACSSDAPRRG